MKFIKIPVLWAKNDEVDFEALGIDKEPEYEHGTITINADFIESFNVVEEYGYIIIRMNNLGCFKTTLTESALIELIML